MADPDAPSRGWWATLPGILTALAGIITALAGLFAVLGQQGVLGGKAPAAATSFTTAPPSAATLSPNSQATATRRAATDAAQIQPVAGVPVKSPAQVIEGLRAQGFKGLAVTAVDGSVISLPPTAEIHGQSFPLNNGQHVQFDRIVSVEVEQPWNGSVTITLTNGQQLAATTGNYTLSGVNELGRYMASMSDVRRIDFVR